MVLRLCIVGPYGLSQTTTTANSGEITSICETSIYKSLMSKAFDTQSFLFNFTTSGNDDFGGFAQERFDLVRIDIFSLTARESFWMQEQYSYDWLCTLISDGKCGSTRFERR